MFLVVAGMVRRPRGDRWRCTTVCTSPCHSFWRFYQKFWLRTYNLVPEFGYPHLRVCSGWRIPFYTLDTQPSILHQFAVFSFSLSASSIYNWRNTLVDYSLNFIEYNNIKGLDTAIYRVAFCRGLLNFDCPERSSNNCQQHERIVFPANNTFMV